MARSTCWLAGALCSALAILGTGCSGGAPAPVTTQAIGPDQTAPVTVTGPGGASVTVPPGASASPVSISITQGGAGAPALDSTVRTASSVFAITPHGATFVAPVTVRIPVDPSVASDTFLGVLKAEEGGAWKELTAYSRDDQAVEVEVQSFSYFVVVVPTHTALSQPPTITITPTESGWVQNGGDWRYPDAAPAPILIPVRVSVTGDTSCPSGMTPAIRVLATTTAGQRRLWETSPRDQAWPADVTEMELPLLLSPSTWVRIASLTPTTGGTRVTPVGVMAHLFCKNTSSLNTMWAVSGTLFRDLRFTSPVGLGAGDGPRDVTVAPGVRPSFSTAILGGPQLPDSSDQYSVEWQRSDDQGRTWRAAEDYQAFEMQMEPDPHLWSSDLNQGLGFLVRRSVFTAPPARAEDDGALFQARACYDIPPQFQQYSPSTTSCVFSGPARLTVSGSTGSPGAPTITQQPQAASVTAPASATFSVAASGGAPLGYQWLRNGTAIPGATAASYASPPTAVADSGAVFSVVVWNSAGVVVSTPALLTVAAPAGFGVASVTPADGSTGNALSTLYIRASFTSDIACASLPPDSLQVFEGSARISGAIACSGPDLSFLSQFALPSNTTLRVQLDPGIGDGAGHTLGTPFQWSFGVAPWTRQIGTPAYDEARAVQVDVVGNVYAVGTTHGGLDGNTLSGITDMFAVKYLPSGLRLWTQQLGVAGASTDGLAAAVDTSGNLYVAGETSGALDGNASQGSLDLFVVKYNPAGVKLWSRQVGTASDDHLGGLAITPFGNLILSGWTQGVFPGTSPAGAEDIVLIQMDLDGNVQWIGGTGSTGTDEPTCVAVDGAGNRLVAGYTTGVLAGSGNAGQFDMFVAKFDPSGTYLWARQLGTSKIDVATAVATDANGNVYLTGYSLGSFDGHPNQGGFDGFVVKYDPSGTKQWSVSLATPGDDFGLGIAVDSTGVPYVVGRTSGALDGGSNNSATQLYVARLDPATGALSWVFQEGGIPHGFDTAEGIALDGQNSVFASGFTNGGLDGNTNAGDYDAFVIKVGTDGRKR